MRRLVLAPIVAYQRVAVAGPAAALQVRADLLGLRRPGHSRLRHTAGAGAGGVAGAALQSVQPRRLGSRGCPASVPPPRPEPMTTLPIANPVQPLIDVFDSVLVFFHDTVGLSWGFSIIALTIVVRTALIPLTLKQFKSMQALQRLSPADQGAAGEVQGRPSAPEPGDDEVLPGEQGQPVRVVPAPGAAAAGVLLAVLHAAQGPEDRHLRSRGAHPGGRPRSTGRR